MEHGCLSRQASGRLRSAKRRCLPVGGGGGRWGILVFGATRRAAEAAASLQAAQAALRGVLARPEPWEAPGGRQGRGPRTGMDGIILRRAALPVAPHPASFAKTTPVLPITAAVTARRPTTTTPLPAGQKGEESRPRWRARRRALEGTASFQAAQAALGGGVGAACAFKTVQRGRWSGVVKQGGEAGSTSCPCVRAPASAASSAAAAGRGRW